DFVDVWAFDIPRGTRGSLLAPGTCYPALRRLPGGTLTRWNRPARTPGPSRYRAPLPTFVRTHHLLRVDHHIDTPRLGVQRPGRARLGRRVPPCRSGSPRPSSPASAHPRLYFPSHVERGDSISGMMKRMTRATISAGTLLL